MKLVDYWYFPKSDVTTDDARADELREAMREQYEHLLKKASSQQQEREKALKLKSAKNYLVSTSTRSVCSHVHVCLTADLTIPFMFLHSSELTTFGFLALQKRCFGTDRFRNHLQNPLFPKWPRL